MASPTITIRAGHPDFLDYPWAESLIDWEIDDLVDLPKGISRHTVRFVEHAGALYAIKELPERAARNDYQVLRQLEDFHAPAVEPVGIVVGRSGDPHDEMAAALITRYENFAFSYRELLAGPGFGGNRRKMLDAFAYLLAQLHLLGCFWGDCSLSNVLYRWDADAIETVMVDAETARIHPEGLTPGQRAEDIAIMIENVAGGMADVAAQAGSGMDHADLEMGSEIATRYESLWRELRDEQVIGESERYLINARIERINALGFDVEEVDVIRDGESDRLAFKLRLGGRSYHSRRLKDMTGIDALENQARQILNDLYYYQSKEGSHSPTMKNVSAVRWRVGAFEPMVEKLREVALTADPIQAYTDLLHHRYLMATDEKRDVSTTEAFEHWLDAGQPGYPSD